MQVQERESDIHADAVIVSRAQPSDPRHGRIPAVPAAVLPSKIIVPLIVMRGLIFEQFASAGVRFGLWPLVYVRSFTKTSERGWKQHTDLILRI